MEFSVISRQCETEVSWSLPNSGRSAGSDECGRGNWESQAIGWSCVRCYNQPDNVHLMMALTKGIEVVKVYCLIVRPDTTLGECASSLFPVQNNCVMLEMLCDIWPVTIIISRLLFNMLKCKYCLKYFYCNNCHINYIQITL